MIEQLTIGDLRYLLGFFMALSLRRGRIDAILGGVLAKFPVREKLAPKANSGGATEAPPRDPETGKFVSQSKTEGDQ